MSQIIAGIAGLSGKSWALIGALGFYLSVFAGPLLMAGVNRLGPSNGVLFLPECRLGGFYGVAGDWPFKNQSPKNQSFGPMFRQMIGQGDGLSLRIEPFFHPAPSRLMAERLAAMGFLADQPEPAMAVEAIILVEADGPAVEAWKKAHAGAVPPLLVRDADQDAKRLVAAYGLKNWTDDGAKSGQALARGRLSLVKDAGAWVPNPRPVIEAISLGLDARRFLRDLGPPEAEGACLSRFVAEINYGAIYDPYLAHLRLLERPIQQ
ncbi:hypothetical protein [Iodidimonas sp. MBR-22]|nr:hypothetical protein [Iodidimonas sp. MBR-22]